MEDLAERIRSDTRKEVQTIAHEAELRSAALEAATRARAEEIHTRMASELRARMSLAASGDCSARDIELRRQLLHEREKLLDDLQAEFESWLSSMPPAEERRLLDSLLAAARIDIPDGRLELSPRAADLIGGAAGTTCSVDESLVGGFRLLSADGRRMADMTYRSLARDFWEKRRVDAARELFGEPGGNAK